MALCAHVNRRRYAEGLAAVRKPGGRLFLFFLLPLIRLHREFVFEVEGDRASFLWHVPISDEERAYKQEHGTDALIDRMEAVELPWVFDEKNRPSLLE